MSDVSTVKANVFLLNGEWRSSESRKKVDIYSPRHAYIGSVQAMTKNEIDQAAAAASQAQKLWSKTDLSARAALLYQWAEGLVKNQEDIATTIMQEVGKNKADALKEVVRTADFIKFTAEEGKRVHGELLNGGSFNSGSAHKTAMISRIPVGVVLAISPFNYPVNLAASKIAPAIMAGNSVLFKPATQGALSGTKLVQALDFAGAPQGLINLITGRGAEIGDYIVTHPKVDLINFTGGSDTGKAISQKTAMKSVILELGGKDPALVLDDADLDQAAAQIVAGAFSYSGQRCTAIKRVLVTNTVADVLVEKLKSQVEQLSVGQVEDHATVTPLINKQAADFVEGLVENALAKGAKQITAYQREENLIYPTLLDHVTTDMDLAWTEPFGPVLPIIRVQSEAEAIDIANKSEYGLQASVFTANIEKAIKISQELEAGSVQINGKTERGPDHFPFLGVKNSGMGVQGIRHSILAMTRKKVTILNF